MKPSPRGCEPIQLPQTFPRPVSPLLLMPNPPTLPPPRPSSVNTFCCIERFCSKHGFDFQAWAAHGVPFLSIAEEEVIKKQLDARWARGAAAGLEKKAQAAATAATGDPVPAPVPHTVHTARDSTTLESLDETERMMILNAREKASNVSSTLFFLN